MPKDEAISLSFNKVLLRLRIWSRLTLLNYMQRAHDEQEHRRLLNQTETSQVLGLTSGLSCMFTSSGDANWHTRVFCFLMTAKPTQSHKEITATVLNITSISIHAVKSLYRCRHNKYSAWKTL